jgi:hypothetical protein
MLNAVELKCETEKKKRGIFTRDSLKFIESSNLSFREKSGETITIIIEKNEDTGIRKSSSVVTVTKRNQRFWGMHFRESNKGEKLCWL